ncbi:MAG: DUF45 domain-containing protein, partial [Oscillospiraceae bacterium]|nr:DUF45 domain-containing protein [Oscillospiraceae bacterium]
MFCAICGSKLRTVSGNGPSHCKTCGAELLPNARFCTKCGAHASFFGPSLSATAETYTDLSISVTAGASSPQHRTPALPPSSLPSLVPPPALPPIKSSSGSPVQVMKPDLVLDEIKETPSDGILTRDEIKMLGKQALKLIPERVAYYAPLVGVKYGRITIKNYKSKWGSCYGERNLKFNSFLMLVPPKALDSVVVHELCHILQRNHSDKFYAEVLRVFPDYWKWDAWLDDHGEILD